MYRGVALAAGVMFCASVSAASVTTTDRAAAAAAVVQGDPDCTGLTPFYWEIGDANGLLASGQGGTAIQGASKTFTATSVMPIASASKWVAATLMVEQAQGQVTPEMHQLLTMSGGYTNFSRCSSTTTVGACLAEPGIDGGANGDRNDAYIGAFYYGSGHMQVLGDRLGYGGYDVNGLADVIKRSEEHTSELPSH